MADETELPEGETEPVVATESESEPENETANPIEALAAEMGWAPRDQFRGAEEDWKPADEFIRAGRDINRNLSKELRSVREQVERMGRVSSQLLEDKIAERDNYWQGVHRKAVEDGNVDLAERAVTERAKLKDSAPLPLADGQPTETVEFIERHKAWFGKDPLATIRAKEIADKLAKEKVSVPEQLRQVERAIRKEFPEHFPAPAKLPAATQTGRDRSAGGGSRKRGFADMPADSQKMAKEYLTRHGIPLEKFAESYWADSERKVG